MALGLHSGIHDYISPLFMCVSSFNFTAFRVPEKSITKIVKPINRPRGGGRGGGRGNTETFGRG